MLTEVPLRVLLGLHYGGWAVHVVAEEIRRYFEFEFEFELGLERLWPDAPRLSWGEPAPASAD